MDGQIDGAVDGSTQRRSIVVVELVGDIDGEDRARSARRRCSTWLTAAAGTIILDMGRVTFMSSAGLRVLLLIYRQVSGQGRRRCVLVGLSRGHPQDACRPPAS